MANQDEIALADSDVRRIRKMLAIADDPAATPEERDTALNMAMKTIIYRQLPSPDAALDTIEAIADDITNRITSTKNGKQSAVPGAKTGYNDDWKKVDSFKIKMKPFDPLSDLEPVAPLKSISKYKSTKQSDKGNTK